MFSQAARGRRHTVRLDLRNRPRRLRLDDQDAAATLLHQGAGRRMRELGQLQYVPVPQLSLRLLKGVPRVQPAAGATRSARPPPTSPSRGRPSSSTSRRTPPSTRIRRRCLRRSRRISTRWGPSAAGRSRRARWSRCSARRMAWLCAAPPTSPSSHRSRSAQPSCPTTPRRPSSTSPRSTCTSSPTRATRQRMRTHSGAGTGCWTTGAVSRSAGAPRPSSPSCSRGSGSTTA